MALAAFSLGVDASLGVTSSLLSFAGAAMATLCLTPLARWLARRTGVVDMPDGKRKLQRFPIPLLGGVAVYGGFALTACALLATSSLGGFESRMPWVLLGLGMLCLVGIVDDKWNLPAGWKLTGQIVATLPILSAGLWLERIGFCGLTLDVGQWGIPLTLVWLLAGINAVNLLDGMDGLASTVGLSIAAGIASIGLVTGSDTTVVLAAAIAGSLAGFLVYNLPPATVYLGDAGSMVIGMVLALLTMQVAVDTAGRSSLTIMVVLMAVPIADTALAVVRRLLDGRGIWSPDRGHIHHRLLDRGFASSQILRLVVVLCALTGAIASVSRIVGWDTVAWCASGALAVVLVRARLVGHHEWSLSRRVLSERLHVESPELPMPEQLAAMSFDAAWTALVRIAGAASARRLQLTVEDHDSTREHHWTSVESHDSPGELLSFEFVLRSASGSRCRLRMESAEPRVSRLAQWRTLVDAARRFAQHWSQYPETVPEGHLRIYSHDAAPAADTSGRRQNRAA
jgi:UDP-GlcNAc:undecaprenyl-phosphate GlcNAc-1-phosphate transferase